LFLCSSRRRHTRSKRDWSSDVCSSDLIKRTYSTEGMSPTIPTGTGGGHEPMIAEERTPVQYNRKSGIGKELEQANTLSASDWRGDRKSVVEGKRMTVGGEVRWEGGSAG